MSVSKRKSSGRQLASQVAQPEIGAYYSVLHGKKHFKVIKMLDAEYLGGTHPWAVHICLYGRIFDKRPAVIRPEDLADNFEGGAGEQDGTFGAILKRVFSKETTVGHIPIAYEGFLDMQPVFICSGTLTDEDLAGYRMYLDDDW